MKALVRNSEGRGQMWRSRYIRQHTSKMHEVLPKSFRIWNAARKPLVIYLCAIKNREFYPLWIILSSGALLWGCVCFFCAFLWRRVGSVRLSYRSAQMTDVEEQRIWIEFCFKLGKTTSETHRMFKEEFGHNAQGKTQAYEWFKCFKNWRVSFDDEERSWQPSTGTTTENVAKVWYWSHRA